MIRSARRRGSAFVMTLWVMVVLAALALVLGHAMSVESIASANRLSQAQADNAGAARSSSCWRLSIRKSPRRAR